MKLKRIFAAVVSAACIMLAGCDFKTTRSYTYEVDTGDKVKVTLDTSDGYKLSKDVPFEISKDGEVQTTGSFLKENGFDLYKAAVGLEEDAEIIDSGEKDGHEYIFVNVGDSEFNYVIKLGNSETGVLLGNKVSEDSAKECFERLVFEVK